jgi:hypothetical protein
MAKKKKGSKKIEEKEFDLPEGLELLETSGWGTKIFSWLKDNFSAIILPIIALVILGGGIYLYSQQKGEGIEINEADLESGIVIDLEENEEVTEDEITPIDSESEKVDVVKEDTSKELTQKTEEVVVPKTATLSTYKESALVGEGITHLARRALKSYITAKKITLTVEQKIYAEDYIQNQTGERMLETNETLTFSDSLIKEAINQAQKLNATQIENLGQYARLAPSLNY